MKRNEIEVGMKFGEWTVLDASLNNCKNNYKILCECSCGKSTRYVKAFDLLSEKSLNCGRCKIPIFNVGDRFGEWEIISNEVKSNKVLCKCSCENIVEVNIYSLSRGISNNCGKCSISGIKIGDKFNEWVVLDNKIVNRKMLCKCSCGKKQMVSPNNLLKGQKACKKCSGKEKRTHDQYILDLKSKRINIEVNENYIGINAKIAHTCPCCGRKDWMIEPNHILSGGVLKCVQCSSLNDESYMANVLKQFLKNTFTNTIWEYDAGCISENNKPCRYDIYVPELNLIIECQSEYHDNETQVKIDIMKRNFAIDNGYNFIEIDSRDYSPLKVIQLFNPFIQEIPNYIELNKFTKTNWSYDEAQILLNKYKSYEEISKQLGINCSQIANAVKRKKLYKPNGYKTQNERKWSLEKAQELLDKGLTPKEVSIELDITYSAINSSIQRGVLQKTYLKL